MPSAPQAIGRYQVIRLLGEGGMGAVYLCQDPLLKRQVAVKTVRDGRADSADMQERFQRESEISARLNHPNIVTVFDVGVDEALGPFMTMEYVEGASLASLIQAGPVDPATAVDLLSQGALALGAAAKAGVIHRDVKPENMLVSREGILKLTDFGVAKEETSTSLTTTGMLVGTPTHTAPELLSGEKASPATDRYAFAVTAFQLLCRGELPHKGTTLHALMSHIVNAEPELPLDLPNPAARVFLKALHRDPARRYPTAQAFLEDLADAYGVQEALPARGPERAPAPLPGDRVTQEMPTPAAFAPAAPSRTPRRAAQRDSGGSRLSGPPVELLRQGEGGDDLPPPSELAKRIQVGLAIPAAQASAGRVRLPPLPPPPPRSRRGLLTAALLGLGALVGWNLWQARQAKARAAAAQIQAPPAALPGFASVISDPPQARVFLSGREVGLTPMDILAIPATAQELRVEKKGYRPWRGRFGPENPLPPVITLEPQG